MSELVSYTGLILQDGMMSGGVWSDITAMIPDDGRIGLVFGFESLQGDRVVNRPYGFTLTCYNLFQTAQLGVTVSIYFVDENDPDDYSTVLAPGSRGEQIDDNLICQVTGDVGNSPRLWSPSSEVEYRFGSVYAGGEWAVSTTLTRNWQRFWAKRIARSDWAGRLALSHLVTTGGPEGPYIHSSTSAAAVEEAPVLTLEHWGFHTGFSGVALDRGRAVHDMKTGLPALATELVEDAFNPGVWTREENWDPEDRRGEANISSTEGKPRDRIPQ